MRRSHVNFIVDTIGLAALVLLTTTGWLMRFILPPGSGSGNVVWRMDRHGWGYVHTWLAVAFVCAMIIHLILHWSWVMCMVRGEEGERRPVRGIIAVIVLIIALALGVAALVTPVQVVSGRPDHEERGGSGRGGEPTHLEPAYEAAEGHAGEETITGSMTLRDVEESTGVPASRIVAALGLPADVPLDETLGRLRKTYGFSMDDVRDAVAE